MVINHSVYMRAAIRLARRFAPQNPFAAVIVDSQTASVVAEGWNRVADSPIWHGEMDALAKVDADQCDWERHILYTTAEPCPMCQSAILWAGIRKVVYGVSISELQQLGWRQIEIGSKEVAARAPFARCEITGGESIEECRGLFIAARRAG